MELNQKHFRAIIYYNFQTELSQPECLPELLAVFGNEAPHQSTISRWYGEFKRGRVSLSDDPRVGAPKTAVTEENVDAVRKLIIEDRHVTYREIEASFKISKTSIQKNLHEELGLRKLVCRWIPHLLTEEQKAARVNCCQKTLDRFNSGNSKNCSAVWVFKGEEKPTKVIRSQSVSKTMVATFVSKEGHIATIPLNEQRTVTADWYTTICLPKIITELRKINPERIIILHQDNASSHTTQKTRQYLREENVELLDHPQYSPDLSSNDFFTFPKIKNKEAVDAFKNAVLNLPANEWNKCFENWFELMQMCINLQIWKQWGCNNLVQFNASKLYPSLEYCSHVWGAAAPIILLLLDAVQRRAVRLIDDSSLTTRLTLASHPNRVELRTSGTGRDNRSVVPRVSRILNNLQEEAFPSSTNLRHLREKKDD
ncbi:unnamed protein product [Acanthoscelides obtectus]|uniref:Transposase n=1 Tax=Acanthoscelides obtectus TaxID=200917 RepID=A0A9P0PSL5_ACAOB|nr:unnamed protein product [Acanthoscelides obtectus]CAK1656573.1 Histone-lysine N-methyltransferase SETMAR [Acanthoscelides obtectus]